MSQSTRSHLPKAKKTPFAYDEKIGMRVCRRAREFGVILRPLGPVIVLMPPLCVSLTELEFIYNVVKRSIVDVTEKGL